MPQAHVAWKFRKKTCKQSLDLCIDVIYHNNMKAFGLHQLILLYIRWEKEKNQDDEEGGQKEE